MTYKISGIVLLMTLLASGSAILVAHRLFPQGDILRSFVVAGAIVCVFAVAMAFVFAQYLVAPLKSMHATMMMVSKGELPERTNQRYAGELGGMQERVDELVGMLERNASFAQKVGEGEFHVNFKAASANDSLGLALMEMRDNLLKNDSKEKEHGWIAQGLAEGGEILRRHDTLTGLGDAILQFTIEKAAALQGAFYTVDSENGEITLQTCYAYHRKKYLKRTFKFAEGLVGQAVAEKTVVLRTEIPDDYLSISSGILGDQKPGCIVIVPLIANEEIFGALEFAGLTRFDETRLKFLNELSIMLARTIFNINVSERTRHLLAESQKLGADLREKQEVLSQNAEEMQATGEELRRSNQLLEEQIEEVNRTRNRMQLLLENASEVITIYEADGTIRYISPSVTSILGYTPAELQGTPDLANVHPEGQELYTELFRRLAQYPNDKATVQFEYKTKEGDFIWLEATGRNFMSNHAIHGYIINSRDITERRRAEQEQRMRSKMQALSENSTDIITRLEHDLVSYINPVIETYTGKKANSIINKKASETDLNPAVLEHWLEIAENVRKSQSKISTEMDFPSAMGSRVMQVNAIPEFDEHRKFESVLMVSHDITERKQIEVEIQEKNKKINDSINYAKRIQSAILPDSGAIAHALPDSFILYKPRDVVSGDFPWFVQRGEDLFIAAVDCTGHGVPGALLSLIGYFLLNDIVKSRGITEPGKILDLLDQGVTETLRQDQGDAATKDGMDIALCRVNLKTKTLQYAGAHRPLYLSHQGELTEVKGNKFPVGGGIYKNQTNFTTTTISLAKGDSVYFSSDGYPDQFGGPEGRKFGSKRMRELVSAVQHLPAPEACEIFDREWQSWRTDHRQTDDVLLIGLKF